MQEDFAALHRISDAPVAGPSNTSSKQAQLSEPAVASASSKLEPFLVLARSARGPVAAAIVVDQATAAPGVFCFGELLEVPAIAEVGTAHRHARPPQILTRTCPYLDISWTDLTSTEANGYFYKSSLTVS